MSSFVQQSPELIVAPRDTAPPSLLGALTVLLRRRRLILFITFLFAISATGLVATRPRTWTATALFMPQAKRTASNLSGIAAQIGIAIPLSDGGLSPAFYAELMHTDVILHPLAAASYRTSTVSVPTPLPDVLSVPAGPAEARIRLTRQRLDRMLIVNTSARSGVVTVDVRAPDPLLAQTLATQLLAQVDSFNQYSRRSQATAERRFTEQRVEQTRTELRAAEDRLQSFLQRNREFSNSPELVFQQDRMQRDVMLRQQVYTQLVQALEQAKLDEVRDTPVLTVIQAPALPPLPESRGLFTALVTGALLGFILGSIFALALASLRGDTPAPDPAMETRRLFRQLLLELRAPWRLFAR
ncbi:MAG: Wzz/FepE/Etk N-terminal domain-containing protein [Gemmatimonadaceae bacterium]